jgi:dipeptidyl-peptidase-3
MASVSPELAAALERIIGLMLAVPPYTLGYPSETAQSTYYIGDKHITKKEITGAVAKVMERHDIWPENTRVHATVEGGTRVFGILQATSEPSDPSPLKSDDPGAIYRVTRGDHSAELSKICKELQAAADYALNDNQAALMN